MQSAIGGATIDRPTSAPPPEDSRIGNLRPSPLLTSVSAANSTVTTPAVPGFSIKPASRGKGLQLGAHKSSSAVSAALIDQLTEEVAAENDNPWGGDDLMDVNADEDDWSQSDLLAHSVRLMLSTQVPLKSHQYRWFSRSLLLHS